MTFPICLQCGQPKRPSLNLTAAEMKELDHLAVRDWREWAKRVIELSDPDLQEKRSVLQRMIDGTITEEEAMKTLGVKKEDLS